MTRRTHSEVTGSIERRPSARRTHSSDARLTPSRAGLYGGYRNDTHHLTGAHRCRRRCKVRGGVAVDNQALATVQVNGRYRLVEIDPLTGAARDQGGFPRSSQVTDLAIPLNQR
jgi:hypothetical protein